MKKRLLSITVAAGISTISAAPNRGRLATTRVRVIPRHHNALVLTAVSCVIAAACSGVGDGGTSQSAGATASASATLGTQAPTPQATTPGELQGSWAATLSTGEKVTLDLSPYGYVVHRTETVVGDVDFDGDRVVFTTPHCELGPGIYRWSIEAGELTFEPLEPRDPCEGRLIFLEGAVYTKAPE